MRETRKGGKRANQCHAQPCQSVRVCLCVWHAVHRNSMSLCQMVSQVAHNTQTRSTSKKKKSAPGACGHVRSSQCRAKELCYGSRALLEPRDRDQLLLGDRDPRLVGCRVLQRRTAIHHFERRLWVSGTRWTSPWAALSAQTAALWEGLQPDLPTWRAKDSHENPRLSHKPRDAGVNHSCGLSCGLGSFPLNCRLPRSRLPTPQWDGFQANFSSTIRQSPPATSGQSECCTMTSNIAWYKRYHHGK